jgi:hypothetical protein
MADRDLKFTKDGNWQVEIVAFKIDLFVYKAIGTTITARRREKARSWFGLGPEYETWVERPVDEIGVANVYEGILPSTISGVASRSCQERNRSSCDCRLWSVGLGIKVDASASSGGPDTDTAFPSRGSSLEVRSVTGSGSAFINGEVVRLAAVRAGL